MASKDTAKEPSEESYSEGSTSDGVRVPEDFQKKVSELVSSCTNKEMVDYLQDCCQEKMQEMYKQESADEYSDADMPKD